MTSSDFSIAFHIGAHKTATSHLQRSLREATDLLADVGVRYYGPHDFRLPGRSINRLFGLHDKPARAPRRSPQDQLTLLRKGGHRLVLSEENYIGALNSPRRREVRMRYPFAARRVTALADALDAGGLDVFLSIRNPATFLTSAYCQQLLGGRIMPLERYLQINPLGSVNWLSLVKRLRRARGVNQLTIWRYEDYQPLFSSICAALVGDEAGELVQPLPRRIHVGLSAKAVAEVHLKKGDVADDKIANFARKHFPVGEDAAAFDGFDPEQHARAAQIYQAQIAAIENLKGVTFLRPSPNHP